MSLILWLWLSSGQAQTLEVKEPLRGYTVEYAGDSVAMKGPGWSISFERKPCTSLVFTHLQSQLRQLRAFGALVVGERAGAINFRLKDRWYNEDRRSPRGQFLTALPDEFRRLKRQENVSCEPKPPKATPSAFLTAPQS